LIKDSEIKKGQTREEFLAINKPVESTFMVYCINDLSQQIDLMVKYELDKDYDNDREYRSNEALMLNSRQMMSRLDTLKALDKPNPEELIANVDAENQYISMAKTLAANPEALAAVEQIIQQVGAKQ
jgi:hypothetical protein